MLLSRPRLLAVAFSTVLGGALAAGCGGAAPAAKAPPPAPEDFRTPEGALAALDRAEQSLDAVLGPTPSPVVRQQTGSLSQAAPPQPPPAPEPPPPPPPPATARLAPPADRPPVAEAAGRAAHADDKDVRTYAEMDAPKPAASDPCTTACSALASMARAADHLCGLAGAADARCASARDRVKNASARVRASCPACAG